MNMTKLLIRHELFKRSQPHVQETLQKMEACLITGLQRSDLQRPYTRLTQIQAHQDINVGSVKEADIIAAHQEGGATCIQVFFIVRDRIMVDGHIFQPCKSVHRG